VTGRTNGAVSADAAAADRALLVVELVGLDPEPYESDRWKSRLEPVLVLPLPVLSLYRLFAAVVVGIPTSSAMDAFEAMLCCCCIC